MFGDVELTAEEIKRLASQARPLIQSHGQWVELDQVDLAAAAAALEERDDINRLTGAEMLRHALGLEGTQLAGGMSIAGGGWADDLLKSAAAIPSDLPTTPDGFQGELRTYQADALAWLGFLDAAGLGGCLALDMGLGKTPTMLAHAFLTKDRGPTLVIAPPAVVGNWAAEAKRFVPGAKVRVHHGPNRTSDVGIPAMVERADIVITTYGTAVRDIDALEEVQWNKVVLDEAQAIKNPASDTARQLRRFNAHSRIALTGTPIENGLGDLWAILDWANPGLVGSRPAFIAQLSVSAKDRSDAAEGALRALNGILVFRRTKLEPAIAAELPDRIDELDHCAMTPEQVGLYQAVLDNLVAQSTEGDDSPRQKGAVLAAITALKQICNHPVNYQDDDKGLDGRSGKLARVNEIVDTVFAANEKVLIFTHFASWGEKLAKYLSDRTKKPIRCYHGGLSRSARDRLVDSFQESEGAGCMVLSLKAGGTGLNLTAANHVVLYDRWWNPAVEDQARDRVWRIGQEKTVVCHRLVCPGTVDERVEEVVAGKRQVADLVLPKSSSVEDLDVTQIQVALGIDTDLMITDDESDLLLESAAQ
jgi:SNF2 family DNA or RNA helicase